MLCALDASGSSPFHLFVFAFYGCLCHSRMTDVSALLTASSTISRWKGRSKVLTTIREKAKNTLCERPCPDFAQEHKSSKSTLPRFDGNDHWHILLKAKSPCFPLQQEPYKIPEDLFLALPSPSRTKPRTLALSLAMHPKINRSSTQRLIPCQILSGFWVTSRSSR